MLNILQPSTPANNKKPLYPDQLLIRINGTLPDIETLGIEEKSELNITTIPKNDSYVYTN
jgi:hypothetical protein